MAAWSTKQIKDGSGSLVTMRVWDEEDSGAGTGPFSFAQIPSPDTSSGVTLPLESAQPTTRWSYAAAASGIVNTTTAVTFKAADASLRNYVTGIQIMSESLTNATELAIRDGAAGTVLWRTKIPATTVITGLNFTFAVPLRGTAATLLEVLTLSASGAGAVYFNAQGFVAS